MQSGVTFIITTTPQRGDHLAKPNYQFEKRQKELEKKKKKEAKQQRKLEKSAVTPKDPE